MNVEEKEVERRLAQFKEVAQEAGVKLTHQRLEIFRALASRIDHPSAEVVHRAVQTSIPTVSVDTVYRTLWLLSDLGLLTTLGTRRESLRFDANIETHHHFVCVRCGWVRDVDANEFDLPQIPSSVSEFGEVLSAHIEIRGVCETCAMESVGCRPRNENRREERRGAHHERDE